MEIQSRNGNWLEFDNFYQNLTEPIRELGDRDFVGASIQGVNQIDAIAQKIKDRLLKDAESAQWNVLEEEDSKIKEQYSLVEHARKEADLSLYDQALARMGELNLNARNEARRLDCIQKREVANYDVNGGLLVMVKELETRVLPKTSQLEEKCRS